MSLAAGVNLMWEEPNNFLDLNLFKLLRKQASFLISREQMSGGLVKGSSEQHGFSGSGCCLFKAIKEQGVAGQMLEQGKLSQLSNIFCHPVTPDVSLSE